MSLTSSKKVETNTYELEVAVSAEDFAAAVEKAYQKNKKQISIPGFRKGKAPKHMIERMYGEGFFYEDAVNALYPQAYNEAIAEAKITPVNQADVEILSVGKEGITFKATVVVKPEVEVSGYKGIEAEKKAAEVTDEDLSKELDRIRERNARLVDVDDRPAQNGDQAVIDFEGFLDGEAFEGGKGEKFPLNLGSNQFIPGFEEQVVGHQVGEEFEIKVIFPENYHAEELRNQETAFKIKLHEIKTKELPELDDEFAKDVSEFDTLEEYKVDLKAKMLERAEHTANDEFEGKLIDAVIANLKAEIPPVMYENSITEMVRDFEYRLQSQGLNLETYLQYTGMTMEGFRKTFAEQAEKQVKIHLALEKIVELENIEPTEEKLNERYEQLAKAYNMEVEQVKKLVPADGLKQDVAVQMAIDLIRDTAVVKQ